MKQLFYSLLSFLKSLTFVDVVFFVAIVVLISLVVTMIYVIRLNEEEEDVNGKEADDDILDLTALSKAIAEAQPKNIELTSYEEEQEEKAIISYDELIQNYNTEKINYKEENQMGDVVVKEVDVDHPVTSTKEATTDGRAIVFDYTKEEAFLETLKKMQELLS